MLKKYNLAILKIYLFSLLGDLVLIYPFYSIMFLDNGLSTLQVSSLLIIWSATAIIAEVPTGVIADKYPRKYVLALGQVVGGVGYALWLFYPSYLGFMTGFILWGIGGAFTSGTLEALVYDELDSRKQKDSYLKVIGRTESLSLTGVVLAMLLGAKLIDKGYDFVLVLSIVATLAAALVVLSLPRTEPKKESSDKKYFELLAMGIKEAFSNIVILKIIVLSALIGAIYGTFDELFPIFLNASGFSLAEVSIVSGISYVVAVLASLLAYKLDKLKTHSFMIWLGLTGLMLLAAGQLSGVAGAAILTIHVFAIKLLQVIFDSKLQHNMSGQARATVTSVGGFCAELVSIVIYLSVGYIADSKDIFIAYKAVGIAVIILSLVYLLISPKILNRKILANEPA